MTIKQVVLVYHDDGGGGEKLIYVNGQLHSSMDDMGYVVETLEDLTNPDTAITIQSHKIEGEQVKPLTAWCHAVNGYPYTLTKLEEVIGSPLVARTGFRW